MNIALADPAAALQPLRFILRRRARDGWRGRVLDLQPMPRAAGGAKAHHALPRRMDDLSFRLQAGGYATTLIHAGAITRVEEHYDLIKRLTFNSLLMQTGSLLAGLDGGFGIGPNACLMMGP